LAPAPEPDCIPHTAVEALTPRLLDIPVGSAARISLPTPREGIRLELLVVRRSPQIVVSFHGALDRNKYILPRFERLATLAAREESLVLVADPTLHLGENLQVAWYTGWPGYDLQAEIADILNTVRAAWSADRVVLTGSSGGGFAALQVGSLMSGAEVVAYNAQSAIHDYLAGGTSYSAQRMYIRCVYPQLFPSTPTDDVLLEDWTEQLGDMASVYRRYPSGCVRDVTLVQNVDEFHYVDHYLPLVKHLVMTGNASRLRLVEYSGGSLHVPPTPGIFSEVLSGVISRRLRSGWIGTQISGSRAYRQPLWRMLDALSAP